MFKAAVCQFEPIYLDKRKTIDKMLKFIIEASSSGADLIVFPELAISGYPKWINLNNPKTANDDTLYWEKYINEGLNENHELFSLLTKAAIENNINLVAGFIESDTKNSNIIYNSSVVISRSDHYIGSHRKITT